MIVAVLNLFASTDLAFNGPIIRYKQHLLIKDVLPIQESYAVQEKQAP